MSGFKAEFRPSAEHPDQWEIWHSRDEGKTWKFDRLEAKRSEPTDEQLERLALALDLPTLSPALRPPHWRESMLNLHAIAQKAISGDEHSATVLAHLQMVFRRGAPSISERL